MRRPPQAPLRILGAALLVAAAAALPAAETQHLRREPVALEESAPSPPLRLLLRGVGHRALDRYLSTTLDMWTHDKPWQNNSPWAGANVFDVDLGSARLRQAARSLAPGLLRIGGSLDKYAKYYFQGQGNLTLAECQKPVDKNRGNWTLCMTASRWREVLAFASDAGLDLVLGLPYSGGLSWDPTSTEELLTFTRDALAGSGSRVFAVEMGEEMAPSPAHQADKFEAFIQAYRRINEVLSRLWPEPAQRPLVVGPCAGMTDEVPRSRPSSFIRAFLNRTLSEGLIQGICMHSYNDDGGNDWTERAVFPNETLRQGQAMMEWSREYSPRGRPPVPVWCAECGPHNGGGINGSTNAWMSSTWFVSALGELAALGFQEFARQDLVGCYNSLLDSHTHAPNPDFYVAALWKRLVGPQQLQATTPELGPAVRVFAHCAAGAANGSVAIAWANAGAAPLTIQIDGAAGPLQGAQAVWELTADSLHSRTVRLNGQPLALRGDEFPELRPRPQAGAPGEVVVAPLSVGFAVFPEARYSPCVASGPSNGNDSLRSHKALGTDDDSPRLSLYPDAEYREAAAVARLAAAAAAE